MFRRSKEKAAVLLLTVLLVVLSMSDTAMNTLAVSETTPAVRRFTYQFAHAGMLHALVNCWCLLSVEFVREVSWRKLLAAYIISAIFPSVLLSATPIVGCSGACFALLGMCALGEGVRYHIFIVAVLSIGFFMPSMASWLHLYCYAAGLLLSIPFYPIRWKGGGDGKR